MSNLRRSVIRAMPLALAFSAMLYSSVVTSPKMSKACDCEPVINKINDNYTVCFPHCTVEPVNTRLTNPNCVQLRGITSAKCDGNMYIITEPDSTIDMYHSWYAMYSFFKKTLMVLIASLVSILVKSPALAAISLMNKILKLFYSKMCGKCNARYMLFHDECPTPNYQHRLDFNLIYYVVMLIILLTTVVKAENFNEYNYYRHGSYTEIQILDKEHYSQDFKVNNFLYNLYVINSHLTLSYVKISDVTSPYYHEIDNKTWVCGKPFDCIKEHLQKFNVRPDFDIKKINDGFSCLFTTVRICGNCRSKHHIIGQRVKITKVSPYIDIKVTYNNTVKYIKIRDFNKFVENPLYVKPISTIHHERTDYLISGTDVYSPNFCDKPSLGCFGPNYVIDGLQVSYKNPIIIDPLTHDRELYIEQCDTREGSSIESLIKTDHTHINNSIFIQHNFGMISIGIPEVGELVGDMCSKDADVENVSTTGCYDCQSGFKTHVTYLPSEYCQRLVCSILGRDFEYYLEPKSKKIEFHTYSDQESLNISCNNYNTNIRLNHGKHSGVVHSTNYVSSTGGLGPDLSFISHLLLTNPVKLVVTVVVGLLTLLVILKLFIDIVGYSRSTYDRRRNIATKKKDDDAEDVYQTLNINVEIGEAN